MALYKNVVVLVMCVLPVLVSASSNILGSSTAFNNRYSLVIDVNSSFNEREKRSPEGIVDGIHSPVKSKNYGSVSAANHFLPLVFCPTYSPVPLLRTGSCQLDHRTPLSLGFKQSQDRERVLQAKKVSDAKKSKTCVQAFLALFSCNE